MLRNRYKIWVLAAVLGFSATSCQKTLDTLPDNRTELDSPEKIKKILVSAYPEASNYYINEVTSDNTDDNGGNTFSYDVFHTQIFKWQDATEAANDNTLEVWSKHYGAIAAANTALEAIDKLGNPSNLAPLRGEALITRAYNHFVLVNMFSHAYNETTSTTDLGIPYSDKVETELIVEHSRGTVAETYARIAQDIEEGLPLISDNTYDQPKYHFNIKAANAFATRFYLYYRQYDKAIKTSTKALGNTPSADLRDWTALGKLSANGFIRPNAYINANVPANYLLMSTVSTWPYVHGPYSGGTKYTMNQFIYDYETSAAKSPWNDYALLNFRESNYYGSLKKIISRKIGGYFEFTDPINQIGYVRMVMAAFTSDETLLNRAEAYVLQGNLDKAAADLITFYTNFCIRKGITKQSIIDLYKGMEYYKPDAPTPKKKFNVDFQFTEDQEAMLHAILHTRRVLTMHEGLRWLDVKRYGIEIFRREVYNDNVKVMDTMSPTDPRRAIQLPKEIIGAGLQANPR